MSGTTSRHMRTAPKRLVSKVSRQSDVCVSMTSASFDSGKTPALFTRIAGAPKFFSTNSTKRCTLRVSFTSSAWLTARSPALRLAQARSPFAGSRDPMTTRTPSCTSWRAISRPIPRLAPVTMAVLAMDICLLGRRNCGCGCYDKGSSAPAKHAPCRSSSAPSASTIPTSTSSAPTAPPREGEWVVSGGYAVCDFANAPKCDPRCYCESSFLALQGRGPLLHRRGGRGDGRGTRGADRRARLVPREGLGRALLGSRAARGRGGGAPHRRRVRDASPRRSGSP